MSMRDSPRHRTELGPVLAWPVRAIWHLTSQCNLRCEYCLNDSGPEMLTGLDMPEARRLISKLKHGGVVRVALLGGEPLCHPGFADICTLLAKVGMFIELVTNGLLIDSAVIHHLLRLEHHLSGVQLSLHCHDRIPFYAKLVSDLVRRGIAVHALLVITADEFGMVPDTYCEIAGAGATTFNLARIAEAGRAAGGQFSHRLVSVGPLAELIIQLESIRRAKGYETVPRFKHRGMVSHFFSTTFGLSVMSHVCKAGLSEFAIWADGACSPCPFLSTDDKPLYTTSSLASLGSLDQVWQGPEFLKFREDKVWGPNRSVLATCLKCAHHAHGRCRPCLIGRSTCTGELRDARQYLHARGLLASRKGKVDLPAASRRLFRSG